VVKTEVVESEKMVVVVLKGYRVEFELGHTFPESVHRPPSTVHNPPQSRVKDGRTLALFLSFLFHGDSMAITLVLVCYFCVYSISSVRMESMAPASVGRVEEAVGCDHQGCTCLYTPSRVVPS
jgi:hypothetical protein